MYKDKDKQREAGKERVRRYRDKHKGVTSEGVTDKALPDGTMSIETLTMMDVGCGNKLTHGLKRGKDIKCFEDLPPDVQETIEQMSMVDGKIDQTRKVNRTAIAVSYQHSHANRYYPEDAALSYVVVGKPGDADYNGICTEEWRKTYGG